MPEIYPSYIGLVNNGVLAERARQLRKALEECRLCPWRCGINRLAGETGQCQTGAEARVYSYMPHHGEERPLRGTSGSGTIFFSGCNLHCVFCQNADISQQNYGLHVSADKLAQMMLALQGLGCHNINLVSPTHVVPQIMQALLIAAGEGLSTPLAYNTGGYDNMETLRLLDGVIDIYMPDMKYFSQQTGERLSGIKNYPAINQVAVREMHRQVGDLVFDKNGVAIHGLLVRHLVLPGGAAETEKIMHFISEEISLDTYVNIMNQFRPEYQAGDFPEINRRISQKEFEAAFQSAVDAGLRRLDGWPS
jgi:putative pyruvate formate lyase activating enzyme